MKTITKCYFCDMPATQSIMVTSQPKHANVLLDRFGSNWFQHFCGTHFTMVYEQNTNLTVPIETLK